MEKFHRPVSFPHTGPRGAGGIDRQAQREYDEAMKNIRMGTEAHHQLGDLSRDKPDYFVFSREDLDNYYGAWLTGFGFFNVSFPKDTTREMTEAEAQWLEDHPIEIV